MTNYTIIEHSSAAQLEETVNKLILEGFSPTGGCSYSETDRLYLQAMFKKPPAKRSKASGSKSDYSEYFEKQIWKIYPKRAGGNSKADTYKYFKARLAEGFTEQEMLEGLLRYKKFCEATGKIKTEGVMQGRRFFGRALEFQNEFPLPKHTTNESSLTHVPDTALADWAKRNGGPPPKQQMDYDYARYRADLEEWARRR